MARHSEAYRRHRPALGVLSPCHACPKRRFLELRSEQQHASRQRVRQHSQQSWNHHALQVLCATHRLGLTVEEFNRYPRRFRHQLHALPRQQLRLQFSGPLEQCLQSRSRQFWPRSTCTCCRSYAISKYCGASFGPAVLADGVTPATFENGFPAIIQPVVPPDGIDTSASSAAAAVVLKNSNLFVVNQNFKNPYVESWNFAIQQSLPGKFVLDVAYVGNHSVDTVVNYNLNAATIAGVGNA